MARARKEGCPLWAIGRRRLRYSNRTEALLERLASDVAAHWAAKGPWEPMNLVVPNRNGQGADDEVLGERFASPLEEVVDPDQRQRPWNASGFQAGGGAFRSRARNPGAAGASVSSTTWPPA